ncbi:SpoIVB peptidase [Paenibacillus selenitireducens]|uniref:SpoIVB peptidase n=1 Tax=Paenibacillus selenitireducens TaxID=1324314 RepID=A0A1T2XNF9_9BACL|nr:SpoIVB peptidase [Paenibacillus selenitireducens]OPA81352.1 SpoIVB peptidase [Paenibacillus selenitireducens]
MNSKQSKRLFGLLLVFFVCMLCTTAPFQYFSTFPSELRLFSGQQKELRLAMPMMAQAVVDHPDVIQVNGTSQQSLNVSLRDPIRLKTQQSGQAELKLRLFGKIPLKTVKVNVVPDLKIIPGGQTIGVKVKSAGILVVGHHLVAVGQERKVSPGEDANIQLGDLITRINGEYVNDVTKVAPIVTAAGEAKRPIELTIKRNETELHTKLTPAYDVDEKTWRLGLYIRDSAAGVGTLTFYAPDQGVFGALGHVITDMDTQTPIVVGNGEIVQSNVTSISKSQNGEPGEKKAYFLKESKILGNVERNTHFGIFGKMRENPEHSLFKEGIPVAFAEDVKLGPAQILTVIDGQQVERFNIEIAHVAHQSAPATKGMVIRITDPRLLEKTGGIVQGMSGSPIIQNGKLIGAVTHVFVNDPKSGYGCFIEWMLQDAGVMLRSTNTNLKAS